MSLKIQPREVAHVTILDVTGRIVLGDEIGALRDAVRNLIADGKKKIILNLAGVDYMDSSGVGELVSSYTTVRNAGGIAKLLNLNKRNVELLIATKLATIFEIFNGEQDAVNSFFPGREIKGFDILEFVKTQKD